MAINKLLCFALILIPGTRAQINGHQAILFPDSTNTNMGYITYIDSGKKMLNLSIPTALTHTYALKFPLDTGTGALCNDGAGNLSWCAVSGAGNFVTTDTDQTITGKKTFTNNLIMRASPIQFTDAGGGASWTIQTAIANQLNFYDSGGVLQMTVNNNGFPNIGGSGAELRTPSLIALTTSANSPAMLAKGTASQTADIFQVETQDTTKRLWVDNTGGTHISNCVAGCGTPSNYVTTDTTQTINATKTITQNWLFKNVGIQFSDASGTPSWTVQTTISNQLNFYDSGGLLQATFNNNGFPNIGGSGAELRTPSLLAFSTSANSPAMLAKGAASQTADIFQVETQDTTKILWVPADGTVRFKNLMYGSAYTGTGLANLCVNASGQFYRGSPGC